MKPSLNNWRRSRPRAWLVALALVCLAVVVQFSFEPWMHQVQPFGLFLIVTVAACWLGGTIAGVVAAVSGLFFGWYFFVGPQNSFYLPSWENALPVIVYAFVTTSTVLLFHHTRCITSQLTESCERFRLVSAAATDAVYEWDITKNFLWWSEGVQKLFGYPEGKVEHTIQWWNERLHPQDSARVSRSLDKALQSSSREQWEEEYRFRCLDGSYAYVCDRGSFVRDRSGQAVRMFGGMTDITERKRLERERERLFSVGADMLLIADFQGRYKWVSPAWERTLGWSAPELLARSWREFVHPDDAAATLGLAEKLIAGGDVSGFENRYLCKDGSYRWLTWKVKGFPDEALFYAGAMDITERKQHEAALQAQTALLEALAESVPDGILIISPHGRLLFCNQHFVDIWRMPAEVLANRSDEKAIEWALTQVADPIQFREGVSRIYRDAARQPCREELMMRDGRVFDRYGAPVKMHDRHYGWLWTFRDITGEKRAQQALEQKTRRVQLLADTAGHLLSTDSPEQMTHRVFERISGEMQVDMYFNFRAEDGRGLVLDSCAGVPDDALQRLRGQRTPDGFCNGVEQQRHPWTLSYVQRSTDPRSAVLRSLGVRAYSCHPLVVGERLLGTLSFGTRRKDEFSREEVDYLATLCSFVAVAQERARYRRELEQRVAERTGKLSETVAELEHFSYTITHDMRAPLRGMKGFGEILLQELGPTLKPEHYEYLQRILASATRMDSLIQDALNYSKLVRADFPLHPVETEELIRDIINSYPVLQAPNAHVEIRGPLPRVLGNEAGLTQCFANLLTNAAKFVRPGERPHITISAEPRGDRARLWFADEGIGIPPQYQERIFGMFQRLNRTYEGTGIGLALVRKAVERMGGRAGVESEPGRGSRFWLELKTSEQTKERYGTPASVVCRR